MANSKDAEKFKGESVQGKYGTYVIKNCIGGGNGYVFAIDLRDKTDLVDSVLAPKGYVLKLLKPNNGFDKDKRLIRQERFRREIEVVSNQLQNMKGIVPILDSSFEHEENKCQYQWYLMPRATPFECGKYSLKETILQFLNVAETLSALHKNGMAHRDIKPANLMVYNQQLCLADFGLIWSDDYDVQVTGSDENIGPMAIRPPELEAPVQQDGSLFQKSDVYLFAKTLWMALTGLKNGFYKRYIRNDDDIYLKSILNVDYPLEPIHLLMEEATYDEYNKRISIDDCIRFLRVQIAIFDGTLPEIEMNKYRFNEALNRTQQSAIPDEIIVNDENKIYSHLKDMMNNARLILGEPGRDYDVGMLLSVQHVDKYVFELTVDNISGSLRIQRKKLIFKFKDIHISKEKVFCANTERLGEIIHSEIALCDRLNRLSMINEKRIGIDGEFILKFVP